MFNIKNNLFLYLDKPLLIMLMILSVFGMIVLYSAGDENLDLLGRQSLRFAMGFGIMILLAQVRIQKITQWVPWIYLGGIILLIAVMLAGEISNGSQRWLDLGVFRFQPSEMMKLATPMMVAWYLADKPLPPNYGRLIVALVIIFVPVGLVAEQPDLGTALLIAFGNQTF